MSNDSIQPKVETSTDDVATKTAGTSPMAARKATATLRDVAKLARVSTCTASKILNRKEDIARFTQQTCDRVLAAASELNYIPSQVGRRLVGGRSNTLGLIVRSFGTPVTTQRIGNFFDVAQAKGYLSCIYNISNWGDDSENMLRGVKDLLARGVDGLVIYRSLPVTPDVRRVIEALPVPVVYVGWGPTRSQHRIKLDFQNAMDQLASHLHAQGHRHVAYFPSRGQLDFSEHKYHPYQRAMASHGIELLTDPSWTVHEETTNIAQATEPAIKHFLASDSPATALLMTNDEAAITALSLLKEAGLRVPQDMSVVGFDDMPIARHCTPRLTTMSQPDAKAISQATFDMLQTLIHQPGAQVNKQTFHVSLTLGQSTGPSRLTTNNTSSLLSQKD